jgi:hypothetical protein
MHVRRELVSQPHDRLPDLVVEAAPRVESDATPLPDSCTPNLEPNETPYFPRREMTRDDRRQFRFAAIAPVEELHQKGQRAHSQRDHHYQATKAK